MAADKSRGSVVLTEQAAVDVVKAISREQTIPAGGAGEALRDREMRDSPRAPRERPRGPACAGRMLNHRR